MVEVEDWDGLLTLSEGKTPIGHEVFVEAFLRAGQRNHALRTVPKCKDMRKQAEYYRQLGLDDKAEEALAAAERGGGFGGLGFGRLFGGGS